MEKALVTTDLSPNSLAGLRFAIQLATQRKLELLFLHVNKLWDHTIHHTPDQLDWLKRERSRVQHELKSLVETAYKSMNKKPGKYRCILHYHFGVVNSILDCAVHNDCHYICISTHGAGKALKLFGTNTGELIKESRIPVLCIPKAYQAKPVTDIMYASDMTDYENELEMVVGFGKPIHAAISMVNITNTGMQSVDIITTEGRLVKKFHYKISLMCEEKDTNATLVENIDKAVQKYSPSLLVMFTNQDRNILELLFTPSQTEKYSFRTVVPLLAYTK